MKPFVKSFLVALAGSMVANILLLFVLRPFVINPEMPLKALSLVPVTTFTVMGVVAATAVYALMRRFLADPDRPFIRLSIVVLIVSLIPDYLIVGQTDGTFAGGSWPTALVLMLMHVVEAAIVVGSLVRLWGSRTSETGTGESVATA